MSTSAIKFPLGEKVSFAVDQERVGMVTGILYRPGGVVYMVTWAEDLCECPHFDIELQQLEVSA